MDSDTRRGNDAAPAAASTAAHESFLGCHVIGRTIVHSMGGVEKLRSGFRITQLAIDATPIMRQNEAYRAIFYTLETTSGFIFLLPVV